MKKIPAVSLPLVLFLLLGHAAAQHEHQRMGMQQHSAAKIEIQNDATTELLTVRLGPVNLPAHADHMAVAQPERQFFAIPFDGWLMAYHPRLTDAKGPRCPV